MYCHLAQRLIVGLLFVNHLLLSFMICGCNIRCPVHRVHCLLKSVTCRNILHWKLPLTCSFGLPKTLFVNFLSFCIICTNHLCSASKINGQIHICQYVHHEKKNFWHVSPQLQTKYYVQKMGGTQTLMVSYIKWMVVSTHYKWKQISWGHLGE